MPSSSHQKIVFSIFGIIPVIWFGLLIAPYVDGGLIKILENISDTLNHPFNISWCDDSLKTIFFSKPF